jgi:heme exporter protein A
VLWLLDEPLAALDVQGKAMVAEMLRAHASAGGVAVIATHEPVDIDAARLSLA